MCKVLAMSEETVNLFTTMERPKFIAVKGTRPRMSGGPRLGIRPDYNSKDGVEVEGVTPGGPADEAGMKDGDIIVSIAGKETKNLTSYMQAMSTQKRKTTIIVVVLREKKKVSLKVNLD